jgi:O-antigen/teichoic acid export membrane protein
MAGTLAVRFISLLSVPIIARIVPQDDLGTMRLFAMIFGVLVLVPTGGYSRFYIILAREHRGILGGLLVLVVAAAGLLALVTGVFGAKPLAAFYENPSLIPVLQLGCPVLLVGCVNQMLRARFERDLAFGIINTMHTGAAAVYALVAVSVAWLWQPNIWAVFLAWAASGVVETAGLALGLVRRYGMPTLAAFRVRWGPILSVFGQSGFATINRVINNLSAGAPILVLGKIAGVEAVAAYGYAHVLMREPIHLLAGSLTNVVLPALTALKTDEQRRAFAMRAARLLTVLATPCLVWTAIFAGPLSRLVLGPGWDLVPHIMVWLLLPIWMLTINSPLMTIANIRMKTHIMFVWSMVLLVGRLLTLWLGGRYGPVWAIACYSVFSFCMWEIWEHMASRWYGFSQRSFVANYARCLPANGLLAACCLGFSVLLPSLPGVIAGMAAVLVGYPVLLYLTDRDGFAAGKEVVWRLLRRGRGPRPTATADFATPGQQAGAPRGPLDDCK